MLKDLFDVLTFAPQKRTTNVLPARTDLPNDIPDRPAHLILVTATNRKALEQVKSNVESTSKELDEWSDQLENSNPKNASQRTKLLSKINQEKENPDSSNWGACRYTLDNNRADQKAYEISRNIEKAQNIISTNTQPANTVKLTEFDADSYLSHISEIGFDAIHRLGIKLVDFVELSGEAEKDRSMDVLSRLIHPLEYINAAVEKYINASQTETGIIPNKEMADTNPELT